MKRWGQRTTWGQHAKEVAEQKHRGDLGVQTPRPKDPQQPTANASTSSSYPKTRDSGVVASGIESRINLVVTPFRAAYGPTCNNLLGGTVHSKQPRCRYLLLANVKL